MTRRSRRAGASAGGAARRQRGFTLIELLVTIALIAVMLALAAPSFVTFQRNAELTSTANAFAASLAAARAEATKRQLNTFVRPTSGNDWRQGWNVYVDTDWDSVYTSGPDVQVSQQSALASSISISFDSTSNASGSQYVKFSGAGFLQKQDNSISSTVLIRFTNVSGNRIVMISPAGRVRVCNPATDANCTTTSAF